MTITFYGATAKVQNSIGSGTFSFAHDVGTGQYRYLVVQTQGDDTLGTAITGVTYNGVSMTLLIDHLPSGGAFAANCPTVRIWGLPDPTSGSNNVVVTYTGRSSNAVASSYNGCASTQAQSYLFGSSTGGQTTTQTSTLSGYTGGEAWLLGFATINGGLGDAITAGTDTTERAKTSDGGQYGFMNSDNNGNTAVNAQAYSCGSSVFWTTGVMQLDPAIESPQMIII